MNTVITLSRLLIEAATLQRLAGQMGHIPYPSQPPMTWQELKRRYLAWYEASIPFLPPEFQAPFIRAYAEGIWQQPALQEVFAAMLAVEKVRSSNAPRALQQPVSAYAAHFALRETLDYQRTQLFDARRGAWAGSSALPQGMAATLARICKQTLPFTSIEDLFIRSGCEPHWYIPPFQPDPDSERINEALSWLDGITVYAPEQELVIVQGVCERMLARPNLSPEGRSELEHWLAQLRHPAEATPPARLANPLDRYPVHPTVQRLAGPLMAAGQPGAALLRVCGALNQAVQAAAGRPDLDGSALMQQAFSPDAPALRLGADDAEQQGWMYLYTGLMMAVRNPRAHRHIEDSDEAAVLGWLMFASVLFGALETAIAAAAPAPPAPPAPGP